VRTQNKCEIRKCLTYRGGDRKQCNERRKSIQKRSIALKNAWSLLHFMLWNGRDKRIQHVISFWLWAKVFKLYFSLNQRKAVRDAKNAVATILSLKTNQKWFSCYLLPCSFMIFINVFPFLYVRANCKEICQEITFPSFLRKMLMSACLLRFKANYLKKKIMATPIVLCGLQQPLQRSTFCAWS